LTAKVARLVQVVLQSLVLAWQRLDQARGEGETRAIVEEIINQIDGRSQTGDGRVCAWMTPIRFTDARDTSSA
jgi:hypothetical protein